MPLRISAYDRPAELPDQLVVSVRCITLVGDRIVVCANADGFSHPWPGGRRERGETYAETAVREVHEETGWWVEGASLVEIGWLHIENLAPVPDDHPYPHPDVLQVVLAGAAADRDGGADVAWSDTEGYELSSCLMTIDEARAEMGDDVLVAPFLRRTSSFGGF